MKVVILSVVWLFFALSSWSQGSSCNNATCLPSGTYPTTSNSPSLGSCGCLGSTPNQMWIDIYIPTNGALHWVLTQTSNAGNPIDVDFILFGPFTSPSAGCPYNCSASVDCSYSGSATEYIDIANAVAGQYYKLLVTNFNGSAGTVSITAAAGSAIPVNTGCAPTVNMTSTPATCGQANGTVSATPVATSSTPPGTTYTYSWNIPGNPTTPTVTGVPPGVWTVTVTSSNNQTVTGTVTVSNLIAIFSGTTVPASCPNGANGSATANFSMAGGSAGLTATYLWNDPAAQTTQTATGLLPGAYQCQVTLSNGCTGTVNVTVGANAVTYSSTSTLVSCPGGADGTATATMTPVVGTLSYLWSDPNAQTTATATGLSAGSYTCTVTSNIGCTGTTTVNVTEIPGMVVNVVTQTNPTCNSGSDGIGAVSVSQGTANYSYSWNNSTSTNPIATDLPAGTHTVTITDANNCVVTQDITLGEPDPLQITFLTPDSMICAEDSITLNVSGIGGNGPAEYIFTWSEGGNVIGTGTSIVVDPLTTGTVYTVLMEEICGSPSTSQSMIVTFPTPIKPAYTPDRLSSCAPGDFAFTNSSQNAAEIMDVMMHWGDGSVETIQGTSSANHVYVNPGKYDVLMEVTSIYGCYYVDSIKQIVTVVENPVADFVFSSNPTTIFETTVKAQDQSTQDVVSWQWYAPDAVPSAAINEYPTFKFPEGVVQNYNVMLIVTSQEGCIDTVEKTLYVNSAILFFAPNAFTPDGDEFNQSWKFAVSGIDEYNFELLLYNRWGELIWETHDVNSEWDGTYHGEVVPSGSYIWVARVKDLYTDSKKEFNGSVNVLR